MFRIHLGDEKFALRPRLQHRSDGLQGAHHEPRNQHDPLGSVDGIIEFAIADVSYFAHMFTKSTVKKGIIGVCAFFDGQKWQVSSNGERWHRTRDDMIIAPSVLTANLADLSTDCKEAMEAGLDWLHLDVMDGNFIPTSPLDHP